VSFHFGRAQFDRADEISADLFRVAREFDNPGILLQGAPHRVADTLAALSTRTPIYGWFTEGFDPPDLQRAKTLLGR
jgi:hypothetical protein